MHHFGNEALEAVLDRIHSQLQTKASIKEHFSHIAHGAEACVLVSNKDNVYVRITKHQQGSCNVTKAAPCLAKLAQLRGTGAQGRMLSSAGLQLAITLKRNEIDTFLAGPCRHPPTPGNL
jgi:hypothetical protein